MASDTLARPIHATAPSSPKPEEGIPESPAPTEQPAPPATEPESDEDEDAPEELDADVEEDEDEADTPVGAASSARCLDIDQPALAQMRAVYLSGMLVGIAVHRLSPHLGEAIQCDLAERLADDNGIAPAEVVLAATADAHAELGRYLRSIAA